MPDLHHHRGRTNFESEVWTNRPLPFDLTGINLKGVALHADGGAIVVVHHGDTDQVETELHTAKL